MQWRVLYDENADRDEPLMPSEPLPFVGEIEWFLADHGHKTVLEAAVGEGRNSQRLIESVPDLYGCDISEEALSVCSTRTDGAMTVRQADVRDLPFESGAFDATIMLDALTHVREVECVLRELARVTTDGGHVVFNLPIRGDDVAATGKLVSDWGALQEYEYGADGHDVTYMFVGEQDRFIALLSSYGFQISQITTWEWRDPPHPQYRLEEHDHRNVVIYART